MSTAHRPQLNAVLIWAIAFLFGLGLAGTTAAGAFQVDNFDDDSLVGWSAITADSADGDGDGPTDLEEGSGDKDGDGIPDADDYDPTGYLYDQADGRILSGGSVTISPLVGVTIVENGSQGFYQFITTVPAVYTITVISPPGYSPALQTCPNQDPPPFDAPDSPTPFISLGASEVGSTGLLSSNACTPYYYTIEIEAGDGDVLENNFPFVRNGASVAPAASSYTLAAMVGVLMLLGIWRVGVAKRTHG